MSRFALNATILLTTAFALTSNAYALKHDALERLVAMGACQRCNLNYADLAKADLSGADIRGAELRLAILDKAKLTGAQLQGAQLSGTDLLGQRRDDRAPRLVQRLDMKYAAELWRRRLANLIDRRMREG